MSDRQHVVLPALDDAGDLQGLIVEWLVEVGDVVEQNAPLVVVETEKVDTEVPAPESGTIIAITATIGTTVAMGDELCVIETGP